MPLLNCTICTAFSYPIFSFCFLQVEMEKLEEQINRHRRSSNISSGVSLQIEDASQIEYASVSNLSYHPTLCMFLLLLN